MDQDARFKTVIEAHQDRIYRICCCYIRDEYERQDAYQEVLVRIWRNLPGFEGRSDLNTWIHRVTVNTCLSQLRAVQRRSRLIDDRPLDDPHISPRAAPPVDHALEDEVRRLHECIRRLSPLEKTLIALYLEDVDTREMSEILGISEGNLRVRLHRTKLKLKNLWESKDHEPQRHQG
ncbi:MAG: RNA polymerase sigma factor [Phycisphaerae bacterium]|nr:RNA polymerase sigma factor [Phycisphaerae bacterium]